MRKVARSRNLLSGFVTTLKRIFELVVRTLFCLLLYLLLSLLGMECLPDLGIEEQLDLDILIKGQ